MMIYSDMHTHSTFSSDGKSSLAEMAARAKELGLRYLGVSEHFDADSVSVKLFPQTDAARYFPAARALQKSEGSENFTLLAGGEYGYCGEERAIQTLLEISRVHRPDFVINSVHVVDGADCYRPVYFEGKSREKAYARYLETVIESLSAPYYYDVVGHLGYVSRKAPYADVKLRYADFPDLYDEILRGIVSKGKILEVNSHARGAGSEFLPDTDVLSRYFELGGRLVTFGSDAHLTARILEKADLVAQELKKIGFSHIAIPVLGRIVRLEL